VAIPSPAMLSTSVARGCQRNVGSVVVTAAGDQPSFMAVAAAMTPLLWHTDAGC
jgi:hypothetical protein